ncbi:MAG: hypothetical protein WDN27_00260 [Candidatus Saccharibacteria bacterium]
MSSALQAQTPSFESVIYPPPENDFISGLGGDIVRQDYIVQSMTDVILDDALSADDKAVELVFIEQLGGCTNLEARILQMFAVRAAQRATERHLKSI